MITRILDDIRAAPERLNTKRVDLTYKLRQSVHTARGTTTERLHDVRVGALTRVESALDRVDELPVIKVITAPARSLAASRLEKATSPAVEDYDALNARDVRSALADLSRIQLVALVRYEAAHKARKTVVAAAEKAISRLDKLPEPMLAEAATA